MGNPKLIFWIYGKLRGFQTVYTDKRPVLNKKSRYSAKDSGFFGAGKL
jgi:hypothetical protein